MEDKGALHTEPFARSLPVVTKRTRFSSFRLMRAISSSRRAMSFTESKMGSATFSADIVRTTAERVGSDTAPFARGPPGV
jgi:hypothetical protein